MAARSASSREALHFAPPAQRKVSFSSTPTKKETVPKVSLPTGDRLAMLTKACEGDGKCICIVDAVAKHDSSWATAGIGKKTNNVCNMRPPGTWKPSVPFSVYRAKGNGVFAHFNSVQDGVTACAELYNRFYADLSADKLVSRWTSGGGNVAYRSAVASCF